MSASACLHLLTKPAVPGRVKTRLIGELDASAAAALHAAFLGDLTERLRAGSFDLRLEWALDEGEAIPPGPLPAGRQLGESLGDRLHHALSLRASPYPLVGAVGSDHPDLPLAWVEEGFERLRKGADVVLGPARDGGYYFVGVRSSRLSPRLFEAIPWSSAAVLSTTLERARELGLAVEQLPLGSDVDTPADLARLAERIDGRCPRTYRLLESWGRVGATA